LQRRKRKGKQNTKPSAPKCFLCDNPAVIWYWYVTNGTRILAACSFHKRRIDWVKPLSFRIERITNGEIRPEEIAGNKHRKKEREEEGPKSVFPIFHSHETTQPPEVPDDLHDDWATLEEITEIEPDPDDMDLEEIPFAKEVTELEEISENENARKDVASSSNEMPGFPAVVNTTIPEKVISQINQIYTASETDSTQLLLPPFQRILRMALLSESCDPSDQHARRVSSYAVALYEHWALKRNVSERERTNVIDVPNFAALIHDVGMLAVGDAIRKKPGPLTFDETMAMRAHTVIGACFFPYTPTLWEYMSAELSLNHHENWDGTGYPGRIENIFAAKVYMGPGKQGTEIPLSARLVAITDTYDALVSPRPYRAAWKHEAALKYIRYQAGKKFDPELVSLFLKMKELLPTIAKKYAEFKSQTN
jgi:HD-GYP domain-containing protein (c-di-GMP phosphodiesterase class II)